MMLHRILKRAEVVVLLAAALVALLLSSIEPGVAAPGDVIFERQSETPGDGSFEPAVFPHWVHRIRYRCDTCHPRIFAMNPGTANITMDMIGRGEACGECHNGRTAFGVDFQNCSRCHKAAE